MCGLAARPAAAVAAAGQVLDTGTGVLGALGGVPGGRGVTGGGGGVQGGAEGAMGPDTPLSRSGGGGGRPGGTHGWVGALGNRKAVGARPWLPGGGRWGPAMGAHSQDPGPDRFDESPVSSLEVLAAVVEVLKCGENKLPDLEESSLMTGVKWRPL